MASLNNQAKPKTNKMEDKKHQLLWHGMLLFLLGLLIGFGEQKFTNPRMGLAAHLEGLMNGTFLIALGAIWTELKLSARLISTAYWGALYGTYGNLLITSLAAWFGTAAMTPITATGHHGQPWQEHVVTVGFAGVGIAMAIAVFVILWGLRRNARH
jgi:(hydroxyamino)benzene mutase